MARLILTVRIMPESPETDLEKILSKADALVRGFGAEIGKKEIEEIAFGLKALKLFLIMEEAKGSTESLEQDIAKLDGVESVEVVDVRRAIG